MSEVTFTENAATDLSLMSTDESERVLQGLQEAKDDLREYAEPTPNGYLVRTGDLVAIIDSNPDDETIRVLAVGEREDVV